MKYSFLSSVAVVVMGWLSVANADYQTVALQEDGMVSHWREVPDGFQCHVPDPEGALCINGMAVKYFVSDYHSGSGFVDVDQFMNKFDAAARQQGYSIVSVSPAQVIASAIGQHQKDILFREGQRIYALRVDSKSDDGHINIGVLVFHFLPNNNAPYSHVTGYGIMFPDTLAGEIDRLRADLQRFMMNVRYDPNYIQAVNAKHAQFLTNLSARERAFRASQAQINANNMAALDANFNAYMTKSAASYAGHKQYIDSIHDRRTMIDTTTGQQYQVNGYFDHNYINPNNIDQQIQTNDALLDPNMNTNMGESYNELTESNNTQKNTK